MALFKMFKKYDKNMNGTLEINEYMECLRDLKNHDEIGDLSGFDLSEGEI